jgi:hypothetical protein
MHYTEITSIVSPYAKPRIDRQSGGEFGNAIEGIVGRLIREVEVIGSGE